MEMNAITEYIKPELLILVPVLYLIGAGIKKAEFIGDNKIPLMLGVVGVLLAVVWVLSTCTLDGWQSVLTAGFVALTQGILCAGCAVYVNQVYKQAGTIK